jgi:hypothetical protein
MAMQKFGLVFAMIGSLALATAAQAQMMPSLPCHLYTEVARQLGASYDEAPVSLGLQSNGNLLQVFASTKSGTWTIVSTTPNGLACILAAGENWEDLSVKPADTAS